MLYIVLNEELHQIEVSLNFANARAQSPICRGRRHSIRGVNE